MSWTRDDHGQRVEVEGWPEPTPDMESAGLVPIGASEPPDTPPSSWTPVELAAIASEDYEQPTPAYLRRTDGPALVYASKVHWLSGEPETLKTWTALVAAAEVIRSGGSVLYIDFEEHAREIVARLVALAVPPDDVISQLLYVEPMEPLTEMDRAQLLGIVADRAPALAVVDGVTEAMNLLVPSTHDPNAAVAKFAALLLRPLAALGPAVLALDHVAKDREHRGRWALGGGHKLAAVDGAAYGFESARPFGHGLTGMARIIVTKDKQGGVRPLANARQVVAELHLTSNPDGSVTPELRPPTDADAFRHTVYMERVSRYVETAPEAPSGRGIVDAVSGKDEHIRQAIRELVTDGYLSTEQGPRGSTLYRSLRPFREDGSP